MGFFYMIVQEGHCHILLLPSWSFFLLVKTFDSVFILVTHLSTDHISIGPIIALPHKVNTRILHTYTSAFQCLSEFIKYRATTYSWILRCKSVVLIWCMKMRNPHTEEGFPRLSVTLFLSPGFFWFCFWPHLQHMEVPRPEFKVSCSCSLHRICSNARSLTHCTEPGIKLALLQKQCQILNLLSHRGNSYLQVLSL